MVHCAASIVSDASQPVAHSQKRPMQPVWQIHLECKLHRLQGGLSQLTVMEYQRVLSPFKINLLTNWYQLSYYSI